MTINVPDDYKLFKREYRVSPVEFYRIQLSFICKDVNSTKITILAYLYCYGYKEAMKKILEDRIVVSLSSLYNFISTLRKEGLIVGYQEDIRLIEDIKLIDEDHITLLTLTKDPTKDEVGHKYYRV